jgi:hypothetical protein
VNGGARLTLGGLLIGALGLGGLASTALHADATATRLVSSAQVRSADHSNAYYSCLEAQGHRLLRPGDTAYVGEANLEKWVVITKAIGGWARLTEHRARATVAVLLVDVPPEMHWPNCDGQVLLTIRRSVSGGAIMARVNGNGTDPGQGPKS